MSGYQPSADVRDLQDLLRLLEADVAFEFAVAEHEGARPVAGAMRAVREHLQRLEEWTAGLADRGPTIGSETAEELRRMVEGDG